MKLSKNLLYVTFVTGAAIATPALLQAQSGATSNNVTVDGSAYSVFNPTPADKMRSFCTDRPTKSSAACTVDAGHFQYETDGFNWTYNNTASSVQNTYLYTNPTFKFGLTDKLDLEFNITPLAEVTTRDKTTHQEDRHTGIGDLYVRAKYNLLGNSDGNVGLALFPYIKIPTGEPGISNKAVEEGLIVPVTYVLPKGFTLALSPEADAFKNANDGGYHANYQATFNISHTLFADSVTGAAELWADVNKDPDGTITQTSLDFSVAWLCQPNLQLDMGTNIGLNRATPDMQSYIGISQRF